MCLSVRNRSVWSQNRLRRYNGLDTSGADVGSRGKARSVEPVYQAQRVPSDAWVATAESQESSARFSSGAVTAASLVNS